MAKQETQINNLKINRGTYNKIIENLDSIAENELIITTDKVIPTPEVADHNKFVKVDSTGEYELSNLKTINGNSLIGDGNITLDTGKVDDVKFNGASVVTNKIATIPYDISSYNNDTGFITIDDVPKETFWCTYGSTTLAEISSALSANKIPVLYRSMDLYVCQATGPTYARFCTYNGVNQYTILCSDSGTGTTWSGPSTTTMETSSNKVQSLTSSSTTTQYPSAKTVYDAIEDVREIAEGKKQTFVVKAADNTSFNWKDEIVVVDKLIRPDSSIITLNDMTIGDSVYLMETDLPDRWVSSFDDHVEIESASGQTTQASEPSPTSPVNLVSTVKLDVDKAPHELRGIGSYALDTYDKTNKITRNIGIKILDGTESWQTVAGTRTWGYAYATVGIRPSIKTGVTSQLLCNYFPIVSRCWDVATKPCCASHQSWDSALFFVSDKATVAEWTAWLAEKYAAGNPVMVYYPLDVSSSETTTLYDFGEKISANLNKLETTKVPITSISKNGTTIEPISGNVDISVPTNTSDLVNNGSDGVNPFISLSEVPQEVFVCTYGTTTYAEITSAIAANKLPIVKKSNGTVTIDRTYIFTQTYNNAHYFCAPFDGISENGRIIVTSANAWSVGSQGGVIGSASESMITGRAHSAWGITTTNYDLAVKHALTDTDNPSKNPAYTDAEKTAARNKIGAISASDLPTIGTLDTTSATGLNPVASESFSNNLALHKISKTGNYNDLLNKPNAVTVTDQAVTSAGNVVTSLSVNNNTITAQKLPIASSLDAYNSTGKAQVPTSGAVANYIAARGENLLTNGTFLLNSNYNFDAFNRGTGGGFRTDDAYYCGGCVQMTGSTSPCTREYIPVDPNQTYKLSYYIKSSDTKVTQFDWIDMSDIDHLSITANYIMFISNTTTYLTEDLKPGDTVVHVNNVSAWQASTSGYKRGLIFWDYTNSKGYGYKIEGYSRYRYANQGAWASTTLANETEFTVGKVVGDCNHKDWFLRSGSGTSADPYVYTKATTYVAGTIYYYYSHLSGQEVGLWSVTDRSAFDDTNNTITLKNPWQGRTFTSGTYLSQSSSGGTYKYLNAGYTVSPANTWVNKVGYLKGVGVNDATGKFRDGTAFVRVGFLINYMSQAGGDKNNAVTKLSNLTFALSIPTTPSDIGAAPISHAVNATTYGIGTSDAYGHVKIITGDLNGKTHNGGYAASQAHTHGQYSLTSHNHDSKYSAINHNHDTAYSPINHTHGMTWVDVEITED